MRPVLRSLRFLVPVAALALLGLASAASAQITNGSFETGDYTGFTTPPPIGNATIETAATLFETPTSGTFEALIQTTGASTGSGNLANPATLQTAAQLDTYLGTGTTLQNSPAGYTNGSAFRQTFNATAGSTLSFDSDFLTNETSTANQDAGFFFLLKGGSVIASGTLGNPVLASTGVNALDPLFTTHTTYQTLTLLAPNFTSTASYTLEFVVLNATDQATDSGLLVDNIVLTLGPGGGGGGGAVPLPAGLWAGLIGAALAFGAIRMRRQATV